MKILKSWVVVPEVYQGKKIPSLAWLVHSLKKRKVIVVNRFFLDVSTFEDEDLLLRLENEEENEVYINKKYSNFNSTISFF